jgi:hypothetical protein
MGTAWDPYGGLRKGSLAMLAFVLTTLVSAQLPPHVELAQIAPPFGTRLLELDEPGWAAAPDLDGDGVDDFVLAAPSSHIAGLYSGSVYILFGPLDTSFGLAPEDEVPGRGLRLDGIESHDRLGADLASAGDLNGDGVEDLGLTLGDEALVVFGGAHLRSMTSMELSTLDGTLGFRLPTSFPAHSRHVFTPVGDVNADGMEDLFIGMPRRDDPWVPIPLADDVRSAVVGDVDGDGDEDLLVAEGNHDSIAVLLNAGDGSFPTRSSLTLMDNRGLHLHDLDGDGDLDLVAEFLRFLSGGNIIEGSFAVFQNRNGTFLQDASYRVDNIGRGIEVALGDLDGDGDSDIGAINFMADTGTPTSPVTNVSTFTNDGSSRFSLRYTRRFSYHSRHIALLDEDGDKDLDVLVATDRIVSSTTPQIRVHRNIRKGVFGTGPQITLPFFASTLEVADIDGDGHQDLFTPSKFFPGSPGGLLDGVALSYPRSLGGQGHFGDIDSNGTLDFVIGDFSDGVLANLNPGNGGFEDHRLYRYAAIRGEPRCGDLDGDGNLDLVVEERARLDLAFNRGDGTFGGASSGGAWVVFGRVGIGKGGTLDLDGLDGSDGFRIPGAESDAHVGWAASKAGDMNADGVLDFAFTSPFTDGGRGDLFVVYGATDLGAAGTLDPFALTAATGIRVHGVEVGGFCRAVLGGLDVDGDGRPDLVCGGPGLPVDGMDDAGRVSIIYGSAALVSAGDFDLTQLGGSRGYSILGEEGTFIGETLLALGDYDRDGRADFAAGAPGDDSRGEDKGAVYIVLGARRNTRQTLSVCQFPGRAGVVLHPERARTFLGSILATGDWNHDACADLYLRSQPLFPGAPTSGNVHLLWGLEHVRFAWADF